MTGAHDLPKAAQPGTPGIVRSSDGLGVGAVTLPKLDGREVSPGVWLIGDPTPVAGTDKMRCLANVGGALALVELRLRFLTPNVEFSGVPAGHSSNHPAGGTSAGTQG